MSERGAMQTGEGVVRRVGECHCGALKVIADGEPERVYLCHCKACQRRTGTAFHFGVTYRRSQVRLDGKYKIYERGADSGSRIRFYFCPTCGSNLRWESERNPTLCGVAGDALENLDLAPSSAIFEESMHDWLELPSVTEHHRQSRPPCDELTTVRSAGTRTIPMRVCSSAIDFVPTSPNGPARTAHCAAAIVESAPSRRRKAVARLGGECINHIGRISVRPRSQGGVEVPTGGNGERSPKPASACRPIGGVSRFGAIPKPTVTVRMEENGSIRRTHGVSSSEARTALILVS